MFKEPFQQYTRRHAPLCPQVELPLWYLLLGGDELLHWLLKVLQASEFLLTVSTPFYMVAQ